jgi:hypothetical protein
MKQVNLRIDSQDTGRATHQEDLSNIRIGGFLPAANSNDLTTLSQVTTLAGGDVFQSLSAQGTTNTTTSIMQYGVNVFTTASQTDFCTKLPQPVTGKRSTIVNMSTQAISVHPSNVGGRINNLPVDTPLTIPNDGKAYEFICTENPLPGGWNIVSPPATTQVAIAEMSVPHVNGTATNYLGTGTAYPSGDPETTIYIDGNGLVILNSPTAFKTLLFPATGTKTKVYSNIIAGDIPANAPVNQGAISVQRIVYYKDAPNSAILYLALNNVNFKTIAYPYDPYDPTTPNLVYEANPGVLNSPPEVGDNGTFYSEETRPALITQNQLGTGGPFSGYHWVYAMNIPASAATKTYKFQIFLEYV